MINTYFYLMSHAVTLDHVSVLSWRISWPALQQFPHYARFFTLPKRQLVRVLEYCFKHRSPDKIDLILRMIHLEYFSNENCCISIHIRLFLKAPLTINRLWFTYWHRTGGRPFILTIHDLVYLHINGLMYERYNSIALELRLSCTIPST